MTFRSGIFLALTAGLAAGTPARAELVASAPAGAVGLAIKGKSDTLLAVPLARRGVFHGSVDLAGVAAGNGFSFPVAGNPRWIANQFAGTFYLRFTSGARQGMYYTITANTAAGVTVDPAGDNLTGVLPKDTFQIVPHWTLGSLFPPASAGTAENPLTPSAGVAPADRRSEILLPDTVRTGINLPPASRFFFTSTGWVEDRAGHPAADDTILPPDGFFIVRQPPIVAADSVWLATGSVVGASVVVPLATQASGKQDNYVGLIRPVDVPLAQSGLQTGFVDSLGKAGFQRRDTLLVFDNAVAAYHKSAAKSYFRVAGTWYSDARGNPVADNDVLAAGSGFVIRKFERPAGATAWWTNSPGY